MVYSPDDDDSSDEEEGRSCESHVIYSPGHVTSRPSHVMCTIYMYMYMYNVCRQVMFGDRKFIHIYMYMYMYTVFTFKDGYT